MNPFLTNFWLKYWNTCTEQRTGMWWDWIPLTASIPKETFPWTWVLNPQGIMLRELCTLLASLWWWTDRCPKESKDRNKKLVIFRSSLDLRKRDSRKITCIWGILSGMILIWRIQSFRFILSHVNPTSFSGNFYDVPAWLFVIRYKEKSTLFIKQKFILFKRSNFS